MDSQEFTYTGSVQEFTVPVGVTSITILAIGGGGGQGAYSDNGCPGGGAGQVQASLSVNPTDILKIYIGGNGVAGGGSGGTNGYASGGNGGNTTSGGGGTGGAATCVTLNDDSAMLIIAGGGGGGAYNSSPKSLGQGGYGGGIGIGIGGNGGGDGGNGGGEGGGSNGTGGNGTGGGANGGTGLTNGLIVGAGGNGDYNSGGGGYGGGGAGGATGTPENTVYGGGGGGSSFANPGLSNISFNYVQSTTLNGGTYGAGGEAPSSQQLGSDGNPGYVSITWQTPPPTPTPTPPTPTPTPPTPTPTPSPTPTPPTPTPTPSPTGPYILTTVITSSTLFPSWTPANTAAVTSDINGIVAQSPYNIPPSNVSLLTITSGSTILTYSITGFNSLQDANNALLLLQNNNWPANLNIINVSGNVSGGPPISNICFPAGTPIQTDQGVVPIERLQPHRHTLAGQAIHHLTQTVTLDPYLICIQPQALGRQCPTAKTVLTKDHLVLYKGQMVPAERLLRVSDDVTKVKYNGEILYNVLLAEHSTMRINNLVCETLHPDNAIALLYRNNFSAASKQYILQNSPHNKTPHPTHKRLIQRIN